MTVAFVVRRLSNYRLLGAVIDQALRAGIRVECWHDYSFPRYGLKEYLFPATDSAPRFHYGRPHVREYQGPADLVERLERVRVDAVVSLTPLTMDTAGVVPKRRPPWVCLQSGPDTFMYSLRHLESCDLLALYTPWWLDWGASLRSAVEGTGNLLGTKKTLAERGRFVGYPGADPAGLVDREEVRRRWNIPRRTPVVVLLPFPQGVGRNTFWPRKVFAEPSRAKRVLNTLAYGQFTLLRNAWRDVQDADIARALRAFCQRNGAFLLVKSRVKTPVPAYLREIADLCIYDEGYYPSTIIEALCIADLCVSYYSLGVLEAAALGVPNLCVTYSAEQYLGSSADDSLRVYFESFFVRNPGWPFEFGTVSRTVDPQQGVELLTGSTVGTFCPEVGDLDAYAGRFLGAMTGTAAAKNVAAIEQYVRSEGGSWPDRGSLKRAQRRSRS